jgi:hypothetical protein
VAGHRSATVLAGRRWASGIAVAGVVYYLSWAVPGACFVVISFNLRQRRGEGRGGGHVLCDETQTGGKN